MAFTAFQTTDFVHGDLLALVFGLEFVVHFSVITVGFRFYFGLAVAIDAPSHGQFGILVHLIHGFNRTVARLAFYPTSSNVLSVIEISQIRQVVDAHPFDGFLFITFDVSTLFSIPTDGLVNFCNLRRTLPPYFN